MIAAHDTQALADCPFCGKAPEVRDLRDVLYTSGSYWRETEHGRQYVGHKDRLEGDQPCWKLLCQVTHGGCGAQVSADSRDEVIQRWNRRPALASRLQEKEGQPALSEKVKSFRLLLAAEIGASIDVSGDIARQEAQIDLADHLLVKFNELFPEAS